MTDKIDYMQITREILAGCLFIPAETIAEDADINSLSDIDSLTFELIILETEKFIGQEVDPIALLDMRTVKDMAELLKKARQ
ncbi:acyl carrier protein [Pseudochrobactrum kiredjianiae]|uniref:Acyl carrier protein n=1 Tax=Pseudochrobactrum kiredjianiae TaxID=386305 RepID=A0ABW3V459_9HYPH|nr:phosphopantetheine-binding protein [Pseudochrobactrum kiredjianiae]MDM7852264.1 phosphopantetheine-binding protein [Pseudochrobactrum kiredjianiae]